MGPASLWKSPGAGMGGDPFWGVGQQAGKQVMDTQLGGYHTIWSPLCGSAALRWHQALLRKWKEALGM